MKKITLFLFLLGSSYGSFAQCINEFAYPSDPVVSNNSGESQQIIDCSYANTYAEVTNLNIGSDYIFTSENLESVQRYITVTDLSNNVLASGFSPLTVPSVTNTTLRAHYTVDELCTELPDCNISTIQAVLTCPFPTNILITNVTTTSATFGWTLGESESSWEVLVLTDGSTPPDASTSGNTALFNPYTTSILTAGNDYQFYIRANCGDEFSPWTGPFNFSSACLPIDNVNEDFNSTPDGELPFCWTSIVQTPVSPSTSTIASSVGEVIMSNFDANGTIILALPKLTNLGDGTQRLKIKARGDANGQTLQVGTLNAVNDDAVFTSLQEIEVGEFYDNFTIDFTSYTGIDTYVGIKNTSGQFFSIYVDDVIWELAPLCPDVTSIAVSNTTTDSATISWTPGGTQTSWDIVVGEIEVTDPDSLTPINPAPTGTPEAILSGLVDNTNYKVWVRTVCGNPNGNGEWIGPVTFKTECFATNLFDENFDATSGTELPDCWSSVLNGEGLDSALSYVQGSDFTYNSPFRSAELNNGTSSTNANIILASPKLNNLSDGTHRLKLFATAYASSSIQVGTLDTNTDTAVFTPLQTIAITTTHTEYIVDFTTYSGSDTYIGIRHNSPNIFESIFIDDVSWELAPLCGDVQNINVIATTPNSATINWAASSTGETIWDVVYGDTTITDPNSLTPISPQPSVTPEVMISDLTENTEYNVWVRSVCGDPNGNGNYIGPFVFTTPCDATDVFDENFDTTNDGELPECWTSIITGPTVSNFAYVATGSFNSNSPEKAVELNIDSSGADDYVMLVSPNINTLSSGLHRLKFYARTSFGTGSIEVGTLDNNIENGTYTVFQTINPTESYAEYIIDFAGYAGSDNYISFRNSSDPYSSVYLDDIVWELSPLCPDVTDITVNNITAESADVTWTGGGTESNWQVVFSESTITDPSTLTPSNILDTTNFDLTDLADNTNYNVWVRSVCGDPNGDGNWIGPVSFTTECLPVATVLEDFESSSTIPNCWDVLINGAGASDFAYIQAVGFVSNSGTNSIELYNYDSPNTANIVLVLPQVSNLNTNTHSLTFFARSNDASSIQIGTLDSSSDAAVFTNFQTIAITDTFQEYSVDFTGYSGSDTLIGIRHNSENTFNSIFVDDISWDSNLSVSENDDLDFNYYPNPVKNELNLKSNKRISNIKVYSLVGQKLIDEDLNSDRASIDMSNLLTGYYLVKVESPNGQAKTIRVIME